MHQALYRKWRPQTFDDVCGQEHITSVLRYEVTHNALSHAFLFCGSRGTGKTTCAKILAKAVNCEAPVNGSPCGKCAACQSIDNGATTDVLEMDAASNNGVDNIRDIRDEVAYTPSALRYRVYIVDEVHMLSSSAFNALLKTLEEPPAHVIFILATTELHKLPATIISRCQRFDFRRITLPVLAGRLSYIARQEGFDLEPAAADQIARLAQGGMRDAISLLELCGSARKKIDVATVNEMMGSGGREETLGVLEAVASKNYDAIFATVQEAVASSRDLAVFWQDLIAVYRDLLVVKTTEDAARYLDLTDDETARLTALAAQFKKATLLAHSHLLEEALFAMQRANAVKRMIAELTLVRMCDPSLDTSAESMLARIEQLEDAVAGGTVTVTRATPITEHKTDPAPTPAPVAPTASAPQVTPAAPAPPKKQEAPKPATPAANGGRVLHRIKGYMNCVERIRREDVMIGSFVADTKGFVTEDGKILLQIGNVFANTMLDTPKAKELLCRGISPEIKRAVTPDMLIFESPDPRKSAADTILDDLLGASEEL